MKNKGFNLKNSYVKLPSVLYTKQDLNKVSNPRLVKLNYSLIEELGLDKEELESLEGLEILSGNNVPEGSIPIAQAYAGHQFGHFTMLGDGRAMLIGEQITPNGKRVDIQLKGSGKTAYSRGGDGRAALAPMLREYIISEAMHGLGIPTTRSLAVVTTGDSVYREDVLKGAILTRIASSHIRVGTFQYASGLGNKEHLKELADYTIERHYKDIKDKEDKYVLFLKKVIETQAKLISKWQLVGFIHGVMNTDNITISGETIDYGPCAFMDKYDPNTVFSSIDVNGRYAYGNQPNIVAWDLARFAESLLPILHEDRNEGIKLAQNAISDFSKIYNDYWLSGMRKKLGLFNEEKEDKYIVEGLLSTMYKYGADYTNTFRALTLDKIEETGMLGTDEFNKWHGIWKERLKRQDESWEESLKLMKNNNPAIIPRNHKVEEALSSADKKADYSVMDKLLEVLQNPYEYSKEQEEYAKIENKSNVPYRTFCGT